MDDFTEECLTQLREHCTMIPCAQKRFQALKTSVTEDIKVSITYQSSLVKIKKAIL